MAVVSREEFLQQITDAVIDTELQLSILENFDDSFFQDITDAFIDYESDDNPYKAKYFDMESKYRDRFLGRGEERNEKTQFGERKKVSFSDVLKGGF